MIPTTFKQDQRLTVVLIPLDSDSSIELFQVYVAQLDPLEIRDLDSDALAYGLDGYQPGSVVFLKISGVLVVKLVSTPVYPDETAELLKIMDYVRRTVKENQPEVEAWSSNDMKERAKRSELQLKLLKIATDRLRDTPKT